MGVEDFNIKQAKWSFIVQSFGLQYTKPLLYWKNWESQGNVKDWSDAPYKSEFGTPVWDSVRLKDRAENPNYNLWLDVVVIDATMPNIIKKTKVTGRKGRIKEYITQDDWNISLKGALLSNNKDEYPEQIKELRALAQTGKELEVESRFLNEYCKVYNIVVEQLRFPNRSGSLQKQAFEIRGSSDIPYELQKEE